MKVTIADIEKYLEEVKAAINIGRYRVEINNNRQDNKDLFWTILLVRTRENKYF